MKQREIKFRGFDAKQNKWLYGNLITKIDPQHAEDTFWCYLIHDGALSAEVVATESVGQFTGLLDKNGKEIYEGDLIQYKYYSVYKRWWSNVEQIPIIEEECRKQREDIKTQPPTEIIFRDGGFRLGSITGEDIARGERFEWGRTSSCDTEEKVFDFEVIGNIYQNADLLK